MASQTRRVVLPLAILLFATLGALLVAWALPYMVKLEVKPNVGVPAPAIGVVSVQRTTFTHGNICWSQHSTGTQCLSDATSARGKVIYNRPRHRTSALQNWK